MTNFKAIILAAGEGSRMKSNKPKVLHKIFDKTMISYVVESAKEAGAEEVVVVTGYKQEVVRQNIDGVSFVSQEKQLGTGHAVKVCENLIEEDDNVIILYGDTPLITAETLKRLHEYHVKNKLSATIMSAILNDSAGYGRIIRKDKNYFKIVEHKDANEEESLVKEVNTGVYCFKGEDLKYALSNLNNNNAQKEYYLTDTIEILLNKGLKAGIMVADNPDEFYGVNSRLQLSIATDIMKKRINIYHMLNGVTIIDPNQTYIGKNVVIDMDTIIYPGTIIEGNVSIGKECVIGPNTTIKNSKIGHGVTIENSIMLESKINNNSSIGPFAYIRPNSNIGENVKIGDFVEVKNTNIGNNTKASHLSYLGDSDIGNNINVGCGTITVNYDGTHKARTVIEDGAFIGCNSNLIAPVKIEKNAYVAAGSTITEDVPSSSLGIARERQVIKKNWHKK